MTDRDPAPAAAPPVGAARLDRSDRQRRVARTMVRALPRLLAADARRRELVRRLTGRPHVVGPLGSIRKPRTNGS